jgi:uncharacterized membrane protein
MNQLQILLNLIDFELIAAIPNRAIEMFLIILIATGLYGIIEEVIPVEIFIVFFCIFFEPYGVMFGDT